jgi:3-phenylpropionate/trans-cinnamate dioxygenase ferredoxin subunit
MSETTAIDRKWVEVAASDAIPDGEVRTFVVEGHRIAVARALGQLYAVEDLCSHDDGPLGDGELEEYAIVCPRHGAKFDVRTGAVVAMPAAAPIEAFPVMEKDGQVHIGVKDAGTTDDSW